MTKAQATASGRGSGVVGYNVQVAVETENHLIVTHEVMPPESYRSHLARISKAVMQTDTLEAIVPNKKRRRVPRRFVFQRLAPVSVRLGREVVVGLKVVGREHEALGRHDLGRVGLLRFIDLLEERVLRLFLRPRPCPKPSGTPR